MKTSVLTMKTLIFATQAKQNHIFIDINRALWYYYQARVCENVCRYALMREVADPLRPGNFRGVCPISNRAIKTLQDAEIKHQSRICFVKSYGMARGT